MPGPYLHEITTRLIAEDTVSRHSPVPALEWIADELDRHGLRVAMQRYEGVHGAQANLVATLGPAVAGGLVLSGHVDIVPFADQPGWTREPLALVLDDTRAYGRGTSDMKVFLAQCVDAVRRIDGASLERPLALVFTAEEEIGCRGAGILAPQLEGLLSEVPLPKAAWIGEPTSGQVFHVHKGIVAFSVVVAGRGGHSSLPEQGANAIAAAARAISAIGEVQRELRAHPNPEFEAIFPGAAYATLNFGRIRGGTAANMIAERCEFDVSYRALPDEPPLALYARLRERLEQLRAQDFGSDLSARVEVGEPMVAPGLLSQRGTPLERALLAHFDQTDTAGAPFCTDGGQLAVLGIDSIICGPGDLAQAHQPDESISRHALERGTDDVVRVALGLCGGKER